MFGYPSPSHISFSGSCSLGWTMRVAKPPQRMSAVNSCFDQSKCEGCLGGSLSVLNFGKITPSTQDSQKPGLAYAVQSFKKDDRCGSAAARSRPHEDPTFAFRARRHRFSHTRTCVHSELLPPPG
jgi:hypothetical protein